MKRPNTDSPVVFPLSRGGFVVENIKKSNPSPKTMKKLVLNSLLPALVAAVISLSQPAGAQSVWNAMVDTAANTNWSTAGNWLPNGVPGPATNVLFNDQGNVTPAGTVNNVVDVPASVASVRYGQTNGTHTTLIASGVTLTNGGNLVSGTETGLAIIGPVANITGAGGTLVMTNTAANLMVRQGGPSSAGSGQATLDMSGLDNFIATISRVQVGDYATGANRSTGVLLLAKTNSITATGSSPSISLGLSNSNNGGGTTRLALGQTNVIFADSLSVGRQKESGCRIDFNSVFNNPVAFFRGTNGISSRITTWAIGDGESNSGTTSCNGNCNFTGGVVDILVATMTIGRASSSTSGSGTSVGALTFDGGTINANTLQVALQTSNTGKAGTGTVNVNTNTTTGTAGTLVVNTTLNLSSATGGTGAPLSASTLNINGGTVLANTIAADANHTGPSTINLSAGGTLVISNTAGTVSTPITTFTTADATLDVNVSGATPEIVATTLNANGTANTINIASLPVIVSYPAQFPIIQYSGSMGGGGYNFVLGSLPAGSPPYQGYLSNNVTSVDLVVTNGFVPLGADVWTGSTSSNWDFTTANWLLLGSGHVFQNGDIVQFDDTATGATDVDLTAGMIPASVTVSNFTKAYNFSGPGAIINSSGLTKDGSGTLVFANTGTNTFSGGITINAGTVQFGNGGTGGNLPANGQAITDNANLVLDLSNNATVFGAISGTGNLTQNGAGVVSLVASNSYSGATVVNAGSLMVDGFIGGGGSVSNAAGTTIGGLGTNLGPLLAAGNLSPGDVNGLGTLTTGDATLYAGAAPAFDLSSSDSTVGNGINDLLQVAGNLTANNNTITVAIRGMPANGMTYGVMTYSGTLAGSFNPVVGGTHYAASVDTTSVANQVNVAITGTTGADLKWKSTASASWDNTTQNWLNSGTSLADNFYSGDTVLFDDSVPNVVTNIVIPAGTTMYPSLITNNSSASYTISGPGSIGGTASLVKDGTGTLTISNANSYTGTVDVYAGTLRTGNGSALGATSVQTVIHDGATLDVNSQNLGSRLVTVSGSGVGGLGAIVNSGAQQTSALKNVTLAGDTTFGGGSTLTNSGAGRWDIRGSGATLQTLGSPVTITKTGSNQVALVACVCNDANLANVNVQQGVFAIQTSSTQFGDPNGVITVSSNAYLEVYGLTAGLTKVIVLDDGGYFWTESTATAVSGTIILTNNAAQTGPGTGIVTNDSGNTVTLNSTLTGPGNLLKNGPGTTILTAANDYTGSTTVAAGTLTLSGGGAIATSPVITVAAGATLDVSAVTPLTLPGGQTLQGGGAVTGDVTVNSGANLNPGSTSATGTLMVSGNVTLGGATTMKLNRTSGATNDVLSAGGALAYGGTLNVSVLGGTLQNGDTFQLFSAAGGISGNFAATNLPVIPGIVWVTTNLANGILSVLSTVSMNPTNISAKVSGNTLTLSWPEDHRGWTLETNSVGLTATSSWFPVAGSAANTNAIIIIDPSRANVFYRLIYPAP